MKKTRWFNPSIRPVHVGYYETSSRPDMYSIFGDYWDGARWRDGKGGFAYKGAKLYWRGLTEKAK